ncbi:oxidoreductase [Promicromonospora thailandica]|uniref:NAD(P)-dependent dehydrogenase, short-chain alcohol dehydrogenase family n=1 Tax=Promicromonospora thailandica TaxID=765201 RepID=A0A9X2G3H6_9MICO|nr:oxidoreductase [Promicromonospora thailandica]MCP2265028.1 NAD(P)-dependent dehydrogenase, short-chain alcohol dehydrogenase family [Promicromonospora thailandica]
MAVLPSPAHIPDQTGRTAIVTGGGSGIGRATAAALAAKGARVVLAVRDQDKGRAAAAGMAGRVEVRPLDLASLSSVRAFARDLDGPVDLLVNNAGIMSGTLRHTEDGFELQLGTNHLGHFALTNLLLDRVVGRVVTVTSTAYRSTYLDVDDPHWERRPYRPFPAYGQSKLANLLFTVELQRRLSAAGSSVLATAAHPGWAATGFRITSGNRLFDRFMAVSAPLVAHGPEGGSLPTLLAAVGDVPGGSLAGPSRFGVRGPATVADAAPLADDAAVAAQLWALSERLTGTRFPEATRPATP